MIPSLAGGWATPSCGSCCACWTTPPRQVAVHTCRYTAVQQRRGAVSRGRGASPQRLRSEKAHCRPCHLTPPPCLLLLQRLPEGSRVTLFNSHDFDPQAFGEPERAPWLLWHAPAQQAGFTSCRAVAVRGFAQVERPITRVHPLCAAAAERAQRNGIGHLQLVRIKGDPRRWVHGTVPAAGHVK